MAEPFQALNEEPENLPQALEIPQIVEESKDVDVP
jgi:hypothetical protein